MSSPNELFDPTTPEWGVNVNVNARDVWNRVKVPLKVAAITLAVGMMGLATAQTAEASGISLPFLQTGGPLWPVELGDNYFTNLIEFAINNPVDSMLKMASIGGVIGSVRLLTQLPTLWRQVTARPEGQNVNYTAALTRLGSAIFSTTISEGMQWARLPTMIFASYAMLSLSDMVSPELGGQLRIAALATGMLTLGSAIEAVNPFG
ncbi:MAG: hypothetical protein Q7S31_02360 [bacterium]|nr:hypothetical protein [bacterium]